MLRFSALCGPNEQKFGELITWRKAITPSKFLPNLSSESWETQHLKAKKHKPEFEFWTLILINGRLPILTPEQKGEEEADVGDVVAVIAAHQFDGGHRQVAGEVAEAHGADHLGHAPVTLRQLHTTIDLVAAKKGLLPILSSHNGNPLKRLFDEDKTAWSEGPK